MGMRQVSIIHHSILQFLQFSAILFVHVLRLKKSRYKTNCDSEPVIAHYIAGVGRKYIFLILAPCATPPIWNN